MVISAIHPTALESQFGVADLMFSSLLVLSTFICYMILSICTEQLFSTQTKILQFSHDALEHNSLWFFLECIYSHSEGEWMFFFLFLSHYCLGDRSKKESRHCSIFTVTYRVPYKNTCSTPCRVHAKGFAVCSW